VVKEYVNRLGQLLKGSDRYPFCCCNSLLVKSASTNPLPSPSQ
jgi:hypothetical protein